MNRQQIISLILSMRDMNFSELDALGVKISLSTLDDEYKKIFFKKIAMHKAIQLAEEDQHGIEVMSSNIREGEIE